MGEMGEIGEIGETGKLTPKKIVPYYKEQIGPGPDRQKKNQKKSKKGLEKEF